MWSGKPAPAEVTPRAYTVLGSPSSQFAWSKSCTIRSTAAPPDCAASANHSAQSAGGERRDAASDSGRPSSPEVTRRCSSTYSGQKRSTSPTMNVRPPRSAARTIASPSSTVSASGFSRKTAFLSPNASSAAVR